MLAFGMYDEQSLLALPMSCPSSDAKPISCPSDISPTPSIVVNFVDPNAPPTPPAPSPSGILKRSRHAACADPCTVLGSELTESFALSECTNAGDSGSLRRVSSTLPIAADVTSIHRVSSAVRFQLPKDSGLSDTHRSPEKGEKEKPGLLAGFWRLLRGKGADDQPSDDQTCAAETVNEAEGAPAQNIPVADAAVIHVGSSAAEDSVDKIASEKSKLLESFRGEPESDADLKHDGVKDISFGSPRRFESSASPMGSFYFSGNSQVYIPDAPDDIMDIPSNQSFAGGGSFCSSPVVISKRLKAVDVSGNLQVLNDQYVLYMDKLIGSGSFGEVHLCYSIPEEIYYAVKVLDRRQLGRMGIGAGTNGMEKLLNEIAIMQRLRHDNIIALKEVINDSASNTVYLVLELAGYGPLLRLDEGFVEPDCEGNSRIDEGTVQELVHSMVQALVYAHSLGVAHRDIKPDNLLLTNDSVLKVSDFGVSCLVDKQRDLDREGSIAFLPPEMLLPLTKEKFIAPSPHVSAMCAGLGAGDTSEDDSVVFERLVSDQSSHIDGGRGLGMAPLSMDPGQEGFSAPFTRRSSNESDPPASSDNILLTPVNKPISKQKSTSFVRTGVDCRSVPKEPDCFSTAPPGLRSKGKDHHRDSVKSPQSTSFLRTPKTGWRYVNRNEVDLFKADVWAVGVTAFVMLHGRLPWLAHLDLLPKSDCGDSVTLEEENNITEHLDPQSRFRLRLYQKWRARQEHRVSDSFADCADHSYLSPYRLGNSSFSKPLSDSHMRSEESGGFQNLNSPLHGQSGSNFSVSGDRNADKEDKQNVEYAFWKYWTTLVHGSHLGDHQPTAATERQLRAILCHPDPVTLLHTSSNLRHVVPKTHSWEVFASSDDEVSSSSPHAAADMAERVTGVANRAPVSSLECDSVKEGNTRGRARSIRVVEDVDTYLAKQQTRFGSSLGKCNSCSSLASNFIRECLQLDPVVRPTMADLLHHDWLAGAKKLHDAQADVNLESAKTEMFADIPVVEERVSGLHTSTLDQSAPPRAEFLEPQQPKQNSRSVAPTYTCARPIAREEIAHLPKQLPTLFKNVIHKAGWMKASTGQLAFTNLLPPQKRATDDSALLDFRQMQLKRDHLRVDSMHSTAEGTAKLSQDGSPREASPIRLLLGSQQGEMPPRSLSLPARLSDLGDALVLLGGSGSDGLQSPAGRRRTKTMAPVFMPSLDTTSDTSK